MTTMLTKVNAIFGSYTESATGYTVNFTETGSRAIQTLSLDNDTVSVVFRNSRNDNTPYVYNATPEALEPLYAEVVNVLQEGEGSIGRVFNRLVNDNKIQLI